jgi:uncharacterized protein (DUF427 family)
MNDQQHSLEEPQSPWELSPIVEPTARWVRVQFGGEFIADSKRALLLIQYGPNGLPTYYFPQEDVQMDALEPTASDQQAVGLLYYRVRVGDKVADRAAWLYQNPSPELVALRGYVSFKWGAMDAWYEEAEQVFVHARDPYKRVDVLASSRHVRVEIAGETIAETTKPFLLFETHLPTRYYLPQDDVRMDLLEPTGLTTQCPYKGVAKYWSATVGDQTLTNVVWSYPDPIRENPKIKGLLCFFNERVDIYVNGELQPRPHTPWSV